MNSAAITAFARRSAAAGRRRETLQAGEGDGPMKREILVLEVLA